MRGVPSSIARVLVITLLLINFSDAQITAPPKSPTLFSFLGVPQGLQKLKGALVNRRGRHPKLEPKPPLKALADAANLESPVEAIKKAAEVKAAEDLKPQKIKAIKYLVEIGCGCYDKDGSITDALIAASDDPTPDVRLAVVEQVYKAANGACCSKCGSTCCCNEKMTLRLAEMAYLRDETGCYVEPNAEIRAAAVKALEACCPDSSPVIEISDEPQSAPYQGEGAEQDEYEGEGDDEDAAPPDPVNEAYLPRHFIPEAADQAQPLPVTTSQLHSVPSQRSWDGVLMHVDPHHGVAHVHLANRELTMPIGSKLRAYGVVNGRQVRVGTLRVYQTFAGSVNVQAVDESSKKAIVKGVAVLQDRGQTVAQKPTAKPQVSSHAAHRQAHQMPAGQPVRSTAIAPRIVLPGSSASQSKTSLSGLRGLLREVSSR